jgi:hypothetical protein
MPGSADPPPEQDTLIACDYINNPRRINDLPWLPNGAREDVCRQSVVGAGIDQARNEFVDERVGAFADGILVGVRDEWPYQGQVPALFTPSDWIEHDMTGHLGELWWGRTARGWHVFAGQESYLRWRKVIELLPPEESLQWAAWEKQRMLAQLAKQPVPRQLDDQKWLLFPGANKSYHQIGATMATFEGGLGGIVGFTGLAPSPIENARLTLDTSGPPMSGQLTFDVTVDNRRRSYSMPIVLDPDPDYRMHAAIADGGSLVKCSDRPYLKLSDYSTCEYDATQTSERYNAIGAFFGDRASLAALHIHLVINVPEKNHWGGYGTAVIALAADQ